MPNYIFKKTLNKTPKSLKKKNKVVKHSKTYIECHFKVSSALFGNYHKESLEFLLFQKVNSTWLLDRFKELYLGGEHNSFRASPDCCRLLLGSGYKGLELNFKFYKSSTSSASPTWFFSFITFVPVDVFSSGDPDIIESNLESTRSDLLSGFDSYALHPAFLLSRVEIHLKLKN